MINDQNIYLFMCHETVNLPLSLNLTGLIQFDYS